MSSFANALYWGFGLFIALVSVAPFEESIIAGLLMLMAAGLLLPNIYNMFLQVTKISIPTKVRILSVILLIIVSFTIMIITKNGKDEAIRQAFTSNKEQIIASIKNNLKSSNLDGAQTICNDYIPVNDPEFDQLCDTVYQEVNKHDINQARANQLETERKAEEAKAQQEEAAEQKLKDSITFTSASRICSEFENNEVRANEYYKDKLVEVRGRIAEISVIMDNTTVILESGNNNFSSGIVCSVEDENEKAQLVNFNKGENAYVLGTVDGFNSLSNGVEMSNCKIYTSSKQ